MHFSRVPTGTNRLDLKTGVADSFDYASSFQSLHRHQESCRSRLMMNEHWLMAILLQGVQLVNTFNKYSGAHGSPVANRPARAGARGGQLLLQSAVIAELLAPTCPNLAETQCSEACLGILESLPSWGWAGCVPMHNLMLGRSPASHTLPQSEVCAALLGFQQSPLENTARKWNPPTAISVTSIADLDPSHATGNTSLPPGFPGSTTPDLRFASPTVCLRSLEP